MSRTDSARPVRLDSFAQPCPPLRRRILGGLAALAIGVGLAGAATVPAHAAGTGVIAGTITGTGGAALDNVLVQLFYCDEDFEPTSQLDCWTLLPGLTYSGIDGTFEITGLDAGDYKASIGPQPNNAQYAYEYWDNSNTLEGATVIPVVDDETTTINPQLRIGATVSGTVLAEGGTPGTDLIVALQNSDHPNSWSNATVEPDGSYTISGLQPGVYTLRAGPDYDSTSPLVEEYWDNRPDRDSADLVTLDAGESFTANFELANGGTIEGTVTNASSSPLEDIDVEVYEQDAQNPAYWFRVANTTTDAAGDYTVDGLELGSYIVRFSDFDGTYGQEYWEGVTDRASATALPIAPGDVVADIDATLSVGGTIAGTTTQTVDGSTVPSNGGYVDVYILGSDDEWERLASAQTDAAGDYTVSGLAPGTYTVQAFGDNTGSWAVRYHGGGYYPEEATEVIVSASATTPDVDVNLVPGTRISGNFYDAEGGVAEGVVTNILFERSPGVWETPPPHGGAGDPITYIASGMPPGNYMVYWEDLSGSANPYTTQYWENAPTQATATILDATNGGNFTGISAALTRDPWPALTASATATPAAPNGANGWYTSNVSVELSSSGGTAVPDTLQYKVGAGSWTDYSSAISVTTNGTTVITYRAVEEDLQTSPEGTLEIKLDKTAPTVGSSISGRTVTVTSSDATSGVALVEYKLGSAEWATYTTPVNVGNAAITIQYRATDAAGNVSAAGSLDVDAAVGNVTVDATLDPATPNGDNDWYVSDVTLTGSGSAEIGGPVTVEYKIGGGSYSELTGPLTLSDEGTTTVTLRAIDANDNESDELVRTVKIDSVKPTVSLSTTGSTEAERVVTASAADSGSGVASIEYSIDAGAWQTYSEPIELSLAAQTVNLRSIDEAGNVSDVESESFDAVTGTVTVNATQSPSAPNGSNGWYTTSPVTVTGSGTSSLDGEVTVLSKVGAGIYSENAVRTVTAQGTTVITFMAEDEYGFESGEITRTVKLDTVVPTVGSSASGRTVTITSSDATSGVASTQYRIDGGSWTAYTAPVAVPGTGAATVEFRATDAAGNVSSIGSRTISAVPQEPERIAGSDRFETATLSSEASYPDGADVVYITTGLLFPDALSAGPAAALEGGPLLLVPPTFVPDSVLEEIERLDPERIVVIGGTPSVSSAVFAELKSLVSNTVRIAGVDRFDTSRKVTDAAFGDAGADIAYIATGLNFPDALAAGGAAGINDAPVILVNGGATSLDAATRTLLQDLGVTEVKVLGGPTSVSTGVENSLKSLLGSSNVDRIAGSDRFETARLVNLDAFGAADTVFLATGLNFPDALAGSAWAAKENAPLYVVLPTCIPPLVLDAIESHDASEIILLGGTPSLGTAVRDLTPCS